MKCIKIRRLFKINKTCSVGTLFRPRNSVPLMSNMFSCTALSTNTVKMCYFTGRKVWKVGCFPDLSRSGKHSFSSSDKFIVYKSDSCRSGSFHGILKVDTAAFSFISFATLVVRHDCKISYCSISIQYNYYRHSLITLHKKHDLRNKCRHCRAF